MNNHRVGMLDMLRSGARSDDEARNSVGSVFTLLLVCVLAVDVVTAVLFIYSTNGWKSSDVSQSWRDADLLSFKTQVWDCALLSFTRAFLLPGVAMLAIRYGSRSAVRSVINRNQNP